MLSLFVRQMCCERLECYVAVFHHAEALCYLKAAGAMETTAFVSEEGITTFELFVREGATAVCWYSCMLYSLLQIRWVFPARTTGWSCVAPPVSLTSSKLLN